MIRSCGFLMLLVICFLLLPSMPAQAAHHLLYTCDLTALAHGNVDDPEFRRQAWDELEVAAAVQGIVNRTRPRLYLFLVGDHGKIDHYWLRRLQEPREWLEKTPIMSLSDTLSVVMRFRRQVRGVVVWDERVPATSNVAATIAGVKNLIPLRYDAAPGSLYSRLVLDEHGPRLPVAVRLLKEDGSQLFTGVGTIPGTTTPSSGSAKCDAYLWAAHNYLEKGLCDPTHLAYYPDAYWLGRNLKIPADRTLLSNHDYFIAHRSFFFDLSPWDDEAPDDDKAQPPGTDAKTLMTILRDAYKASGGQILHVGGFTPWDQKYTDYTGGRHGGVATEWSYAEILSCYNAYMDADAPGLNAMANASVYQHYPLAARYPQPNLPTDNSLRAQGYLDANGQVAHKTFVSIYVGDYDSAAWMYQRIPDLWDDPARGSIPLGWAFNPTLDQRFPVGLAYTRKTATPNDT
ncbi:MAG: hypothetical protein M3Y56_11750, partial [Armatimonadota bacterium]|nr:hypothetical protein [Armatimonadota bacterium]